MVLPLGERFCTAVHIAIDTNILLLLSEGKFIPALSLMIQARYLLYVL